MRSQKYYIVDGIAHYPGRTIGIFVRLVDMRVPSLLVKSVKQKKKNQSVFRLADIFEAIPVRRNWIRFRSFCSQCADVSFRLLPTHPYA